MAWTEWRKFRRRRTSPVKAPSYLIKALNDYRSGARKNDMMSLVAPTLKDKDVEDLAAYYSAIEVTVSPPPK